MLLYAPHNVSHASGRIQLIWQRKAFSGETTRVNLGNRH